MLECVESSMPNEIDWTIDMSSFLGGRMVRLHINTVSRRGVSSTSKSVRCGLGIAGYVPRFVMNVANTRADNRHAVVIGKKPERIPIKKNNTANNCMKVKETSNPISIRAESSRFSASGSGVKILNKATDSAIMRKVVWVSADSRIAIAATAYSIYRADLLSCSSRFIVCT